MAAIISRKKRIRKHFTLVIMMHRRFTALCAVLPGDFWQEGSVTNGWHHGRHIAGLLEPCFSPRARPKKQSYISPNKFSNNPIYPFIIALLFEALVYAFTCNGAYKLANCFFNLTSPVHLNELSLPSSCSRQCSPKGARYFKNTAEERRQREQ